MQNESDSFVWKSTIRRRKIYFVMNQYFFNILIIYYRIIKDKLNKFIKSLKILQRQSTPINK